VTDPNLPDQPGASVPPASPAYGQGAPAYGQPSGAKTNTLAIVSLVSSIIGLGIFIGLIAGVICGHIALGQIKKTGEQGRGMAIAGLIIGYVGILFWIIGTIIFFAFLATLAATSGTLNY
jgi:hypothetical protein